MMSFIEYETAQARLEDEMRKAAAWRLQREARAARRNGKRKVAQGGWLMAIGKAFGAGSTESGAATVENVRDN